MYVCVFSIVTGILELLIIKIIIYKHIYTRINNFKFAQYFVLYNVFRGTLRLTAFSSDLDCLDLLVQF